MHRTLVPLLVFTFLISSAARAQEAEPDHGTGTMVGGIVTTSVGSAVGGLLMFAGLFNDLCDDSDESCGDHKGEQYMLGGAIVLGASLGIGIPMIVNGARQHKVWKTWKEKNEPPPTDKRAEAVRFGILPVRHGAAAVLAVDVP